MGFMTSSKSKRSKREQAIDRAVISQVDNPAAWDEPITIPSSDAPRPKWMRAGRHLEFAAKFHVLSVLHRLGADANLTLAQPDNVDITVVRESGQAVTIDVKTLSGTDSWHVDRFKARKHHYVVFVWFAAGLEAPDAPPRVFIAHSRQLERFVNKHQSARVSIDELFAQLDAAKAWQQLVSESAA
jgi:hypothetical protein